MIPSALKTESPMMRYHAWHAWPRERQCKDIFARHLVDAQGGVRGEAEAAVIARIAHKHAARCALRLEPRKRRANKLATDALALAFGNYRNRPERKPAAGLSVDQNLGTGDVTNDRATLDCNEVMREGPCRAQPRNDLRFGPARMRGGKERFGNERTDFGFLARSFLANVHAILAFYGAPTLDAREKGDNA